MRGLVNTVSSETSVHFYQSQRCRIPEVSKLQHTFLYYCQSSNANILIRKTLRDSTRQFWKRLNQFLGTINPVTLEQMQNLIIRLKPEIHLNYIHSLIHSVVRLKTGPQLFQSECSTKGYLVFPLSVSDTQVSLRSFSTCLSLIPRHPVKSVFPATFPTGA